MQNHPHDSICGCSIDPVHAEMQTRFDQVEQMGEEITLQSLTTLAEGITTAVGTNTPIAGAESAVVVYNPTAGPRSDGVSVVLEALSNQGDFELLDETGAVVPFQPLGLGSSELINVILSRKEFAQRVQHGF